MSVKHITSRSHFEEERSKLGPDYVLEFTAKWCGPCKLATPLFAAYAETYSHVPFLKIDVDECPDTALEFGIQAMPTFILVKNGDRVLTMKGIKRKQLDEMLAQHYGSSE